MFDDEVNILLYLFIYFETKKQKKSWAVDAHHDEENSTENSPDNSKGGTEEENMEKKSKKAKISHENFENLPPHLSLSAEARRLIGWKCKRLIDIGRVRKFRQLFKWGKLLPYVKSNITKENFGVFAGNVE